jgi:hypothetical protein
MDARVVSQAGLGRRTGRRPVLWGYEGKLACTYDLLDSYVQ